jgi:hypothetical protein
MPGLRSRHIPDAPWRCPKGRPQTNGSPRPALSHRARRVAHRSPTDRDTHVPPCCREAASLGEDCRPRTTQHHVPRRAARYMRRLASTTAPCSLTVAIGMGRDPQPEGPRGSAARSWRLEIRGAQSPLRRHRRHLRPLGTEGVPRVDEPWRCGCPCLAELLRQRPRRLTVPRTAAAAVPPLVAGASGVDAAPPPVPSRTPLRAACLSRGSSDTGPSPVDCPDHCLGSERSPAAPQRPTHTSLASWGREN